jgi:Bacterial cadherin-like domain
LGALKAPTHAESPEGTSGVQPQPESEQSGEVIDASEGSTPTVTPASETEQTASTLLKTDSKSTRSATITATSTPLTTAASTLATSVGVVDPLEMVKKLSATVTESNAVLTAQAFTANAANSALTTPARAATIAPVAPTAQVAQTGSGVVGFLNQVVTNLLTPFVAPAPNTPQPVSPVGWAVLAWVRRNLFNQAPTIAYNRETTVQTGQTVTGYIGATDPEGDPLTYTVTQKPLHGTLDIDQATGKFTYTPDRNRLRRRAN